MARDEAQFARDMDAARLASERDRHAEAEDRRRTSDARRDDEMNDADPREWEKSGDLFRGSWLLRGPCREALLRHVARARSPLKKSLVELLKLEKRSRHWYQSLPEHYFNGALAERLRAIGDAGKLEAAVRRETKFLLDGLMLLSNQEGNVPQIFLRAKEESRRRNGGDGEDADQEGDDGEVIMLEVRRPGNAPRPEADTVDVS
jgi:hypothetical protein